MGPRTRPLILHPTDLVLALALVLVLVLAQPPQHSRYSGLARRNRLLRLRLQLLRHSDFCQHRSFGKPTHQAPKHSHPMQRDPSPKQTPMRTLVGVLVLAQVEVTGQEQVPEQAREQAQVQAQAPNHQ
jgi:hypothetical protein